MDSYLIGNIEQPSPKINIERNKNKKHLELSVGSKKGKIRMDSSIEAPKSDLTPRDREVNGGYSNLGGFASRNLAKA
jgi:hypothetical protein